jgi:hypothetical protein
VVLNAPLDRLAYSYFSYDYDDDFQEYKLCKGKDVVKETYKTSSIISLGEERVSAYSCALINFKFRMAYFKHDPLKSRFELI